MLKNVYWVDERLDKQMKSYWNFTWTPEPLLSWEVCQVPAGCAFFVHGDDYVCIFRGLPWSMQMLALVWNGSNVHSQAWKCLGTFLMVLIDRSADTQCFPSGSVIIESTCQIGHVGWEDPLEKEMSTDSSTLAWKIPWTEKPGGLQSMGLKKSWTWLNNSCWPQGVNGISSLL